MTGLLSRICSLVATAVFLIAFSSPGFGQPAADGAALGNLVAELNAAVAARAEALATGTTVVETAPPLLKELKLWDEQIEAMKPQIDFMEKKLEHHNAEAAVVNEKVGAHNAVCQGTLPKPQYERCKGEEPYLKSQIDKINSREGELTRERNEINRRADSVNKRRRELRESVTKIHAQSSRAKAQLEEAEGRIATLLPRLQQECQKAQTREAMAHCGQVNWDGARQGLRPCETEQCKEFDRQQDD